LEELSLKELVKILYRRRNLIMWTVIIAVLLSLIYSFFIAVPLYYAQAICQVKGLNTGVYTFEQENSISAIIDELLEQVREPEYLEQVSKALAGINIQITGNELQGLLSFGKGADDNTIIATARCKEKKDAAEIANKAADVLCGYSSDYYREKLQPHLAYAWERMELERVKAEEALSDYKDYLAEPESVQKLQADLKINEALLVQLEANLISGNIGTGKSKEQLEQDIIYLKGEIEVLRRKLLDESNRDKLYNEDLRSLFKVYNALKEEYNRLKFAELYLETKSNVSILSYAVEPESAGWPNIKFITAVSLTLGILISFFTAFTIEYFKLRK
jgi:capsular polysaccharide biosynthesis protein